MRNFLVVLWMLLGSITSAPAQVSIGIGLPGVSIGINLPVYPELVRVPGYPVYYAPGVSSNFFFYDGMYWVYQSDNWYASSWYNGPWGLVARGRCRCTCCAFPCATTGTLLRTSAGGARMRRRAGASTGAIPGNRATADGTSGTAVPCPPPAPLPSYQRQYSGNRYPHVEQQQALQSRNYRYQPRDTVVQQHYQTQRVQSAPAPIPPQDQRGTGRPPSSQQRPTQQPPHAATQREQQAPRSHGQGQASEAASRPGAFAARGSCRQAAEAATPAGGSPARAAVAETARQGFRAGTQARPGPG